MPIREKIRKVLRRTRSTEQAPTLANSGKPGVDVYKSGEVPPSKYRGHWSKEHQEKLHAFSFATIGEAFNSRKSSFSDLSPGASRRSSWTGLGKKGKPQPYESSHVGKVVENAEGDDDPSNVGRSRPQTSDKPSSSPPVADEAAENNPLEQQETITNGNAHKFQNDTPFTQEELTRALTATKHKNREDTGEEGAKDGGDKVEDTLAQ